MSEPLTAEERLRDAIAGERRDWHRVEVSSHDIEVVLATLVAARDRPGLDPWSDAMGDPAFVEAMEQGQRDLAEGKFGHKQGRDRPGLEAERRALGVVVGLAFDGRGVRHTKAELLMYLEVIENEARAALAEAQQREGAGS